MSLDLRYICETTHRETEELSVQSAGDRLANRSLSDTGWAYKTDDLAFNSSSKLADGQEFKNTIFHVLETVMILVKHFLCMCDRVVLFGMNSPRNL